MSQGQEQDDYFPEADMGRYEATVVDILAGMAIRGVLELAQRALASPVDRVMVLSAVEGELVRQGRLPRGGLGGILKCYRRIWRKEGFAGLFRGVLTDAALAIPTTIVDNISVNVAFAVVKRVLPSSFAERMTTPQTAMISLVVAGMGALLATPFNAFRKTLLTNYTADIVAPVSATTTADAAKSASTTANSGDAKEGEEQESADAAVPIEESYRYASATEAAVHIQRRQGWRAFYRGALVDPITICCYRGLFLFAWATVPREVLATYPYAVGRGLALVADLLTQPLEVVGRRMVMTASDDVNPPYKGIVDCVQQITKNEGVTALWSGLRMRLIVSAVSITLRTAYVLAFHADPEQ